MVNELTADEACSITKNCCDTINATLMDIYPKIEEQAKLGRTGLLYSAFFTENTYQRVIGILKNKDYMIFLAKKRGMFYAIEIYWDKLPF